MISTSTQALFTTTGIYKTLKGHAQKLSQDKKQLNKLVLNIK